MQRIGAKDARLLRETLGIRRDCTQLLEACSHAPTEKTRENKTNYGITKHTRTHEQIHTQLVPDSALIGV